MLVKAIVAVALIGELTFAFVAANHSNDTFLHVIHPKDSNEEVNQLEKNGTLRDRFRDTRRLLRIHAFLYAVKTIRETNMREFKKARMEFLNQQQSSFDTWKMYITNSNSPVPRALRDTLKTEEEYHNCASNLSYAYFVTTRHTQNNLDTIQIVSQLAHGTKLTIRELLAKEKPEYLFTLSQMKYSNMLFWAAGVGLLIPYEPFLKDETQGIQYVIPLLSHDVV